MLFLCKHPADVIFNNRVNTFCFLDKKGRAPFGYIPVLGRYVRRIGSIVMRATYSFVGGYSSY